MNQNGNGIIYIKNAYNDDIFNQIKNELKYFKKYLSVDKRVPGRKSICINNKHKLNKLIYNSTFIKSLQNIILSKLKKTSYPIEYRKYFTGSQGIKWHKDKSLFTKPQYELVLTIENSSDSKTMWKDKNNKLHSIKTKPNSIIMVKAHDIEHKVTKINNGERFIIKFILFDKNQKFIKNNNYKFELNNCKLI